MASGCVSSRNTETMKSSGDMPLARMWSRFAAVALFGVPLCRPAVFNLVAIHFRLLGPKGTAKVRQRRVAPRRGDTDNERVFDGEDMVGSKKIRAPSLPQVDRGDIARLLQQGLALHQEGQLREAARLYRTVLQKSPNHFDAQNLLGVIEYQRGDFAVAVRLIRGALRVDPSFAPAHTNLGNALHRLKRFDEALASYERALAIQPDYTVALFNRGNVLLDLKRYDEALAAYDRALVVGPRDSEVLYNRGLVLMELSRFAEALAAYDAVLAQRPNDPQALCNRGNALYRQRRVSEALATYDHALQLRPDDYGTHFNRGQALAELGRLDEAIDSYDRALALKPDYADALYNRGGALVELRRFDEAAAAFATLLAVVPRHDYAMGDLFFARLACCNWADYHRDLGRLTEAVMTGRRAAVPFNFVSSSGSPEAQLQCAAVYARDKFATPTPALWRGERYRHEKIRVAYLSADFHSHATADLTAGLFEAHDRKRFEIVAASVGPDTNDPMRARLRDAFDEFLDLREVADRDAAAELKRREIDIAIDLKGYTQYGRPHILAHRPAPVQANYLGYPGTMAAAFIDYLIADPILIPEEDRHFFSEKIAYLPDSYQPNDNKRRIAARTPTRAEAGLPETAFVFCSFNNNHKITPTMFDIWMRLLGAIEGSVLWLLAGNSAATVHLSREATEHGIDPRRLVFAPFVAPADHLARHRLADLFLDTLPYNAHTTASDALWAGLPLVTCRGTSFAGRVAASLLAAIGLRELTTDNLEDYEALTYDLARHPNRLSQVKAKLLTNRARLALFDTARFARHIERAYETMRERARRGEPPTDFAVEPLPGGGL
jgi:predicted O-linked N-acetylglucosamine transferase (SPINDLY family)